MQTRLFTILLLAALVRSATAQDPSVERVPIQVPAGSAASDLDGDERGLLDIRKKLDRLDARMQELEESASSRQAYSNFMIGPGSRSNENPLSESNRVLEAIQKSAKERRETGETVNAPFVVLTHADLSELLEKMDKVIQVPDEVAPRVPHVFTSPDVQPEPPTKPVPVKPIEDRVKKLLLVIEKQREVIAILERQLSECQNKSEKGNGR